MEIKYTRQGDYLIPNLYLEKEENYGRIGKYGVLRLHFIAKNNKALYGGCWKSSPLFYIF